MTAYKDVIIHHEESKRYFQEYTTADKDVIIYRNEILMTKNRWRNALLAMEEQS